MTIHALDDVLTTIENAIVGAGLELRLLDVLTLEQHTDENLHRGFCVRVPRSVNRLESREKDQAVSSDTFEVQLGYRMIPTKRRVCRAEALVLEEQVRVAVTGLQGPWAEHLVWVGADRVLVEADTQWLIITQRFTGRRDAALGG